MTGELEKPKDALAVIDTAGANLVSRIFSLQGGG